MSDNDNFTEVTTESWTDRLIASIKGVAAGGLLFILSIPLLYWNEGRAVQTARGLTEGANATIAVKADAVDATNEGKLVHFSGPAIATNAATDGPFGVSAPGALKLERIVEMYQWKESKKTSTDKKLGGKKVKTTEYKYEKAWSSKLIDSANFKRKRGHYNPSSMRAEGEMFVAEPVKVGAFTLPKSLVQQLTDSKPLPPSEAMRRSVGRALGRIARVDDDALFIGIDPKSPNVGDLRIRYTMVAAQPVSVIAKQTGATVDRYQTKSGQSIQMISAGVVAPQAMFTAAQAANSTLTWILRGVGVVLMFLGLFLFFNPIAVVADVVPFLGDLLRVGIGLFAGAVTISLSLLTISISWLIFRPLIGAPLLIAAIGLFVGLFMFGKKRKADRAATQQNRPAPQAPSFG